MLGWLRGRAAVQAGVRDDVAPEAAAQTQAFMLQIPAALGAMPKALLDDPFVVGAIASHAALISKVMTNGQCPMAVVERAMVAAVELSFSGVGLTHDDALGALYRFKNHPEYSKASQVIALVLGARFAKRELAGDPLVLEARKKIQLMPRAFRESFGTSEDEQTAAQLSRDLFIKPLVEKYGRR